MREFCLNTTKYMKGETVIITKRGVPMFKLESMNQLVDSYNALPKKTQKKVFKENFDSVLNVATKISIPNQKFTEYNCGCKRVEGRFLCPKHGRV